MATKDYACQEEEKIEQDQDAPFSFFCEEQEDKKALNLCKQWKWVTRDDQSRPLLDRP